MQAMESINTPDTDGSSLAAPTLINTLWAFHILETRSYELLCQLLVPGECTIHHSQRDPHPETLSLRTADTLEAYRTEFNTEPPENVWSRHSSAHLVAVQPVTEASGRPNVSTNQHSHSPGKAVPYSAYMTHTSTSKVCPDPDRPNTHVLHRPGLDSLPLQVRAHADSGVPVEEQRLIYAGQRAGRQLEDEKTLSSHGIPY